MPQISVIVPVYKVDPYLPRCVDSILAQTFTDFELILVDDGSPDNCGAICDKYAEKDSRVKVIHKENGGASSARNAGLEAAEGDYISFVDSDDMVHPELLSKALKGIEGYDSVCYNYCRQNADRTIQYHSCFDSGPFYWSNEKEQFEFLLVSYLGFKTAYSTCNRLYRRSIIDKHNIRFESHASYAEDLYFNFLYYLYSHSLNCIPDELYYYISRSGSTIQEYAKHCYFDRITQMAKAIESHLSSQDGFVQLREKFPIIFIALFENEVSYFRKYHPELNVKDIRTCIIKDVQDFPYFLKKTAFPEQYRKDLRLRYGKIETEEIISEFRYYRDGFLLTYWFRYILILSLKIFRKLYRTIKL